MRFSLRWAVTQFIVWCIECQIELFLQNKYLVHSHGLLVLTWQVKEFEKLIKCLYLKCVLHEKGETTIPTWLWINVFALLSPGRSHLGYFGSFITFPSSAYNKNA